MYTHTYTRAGEAGHPGAFLAVGAPLGLVLVAHVAPDLPDLLHVLPLHCVIQLGRPITFSLEKLISLKLID